MTAVAKLSYGFKSFWTSFQILRKYPKLKKYLIVPVLIDIIFLAISTYYLMGIVPEYLLSFYTIDTQFLYWLVYGILSILSFLSVVLFTFLFANVITIPFNAFLCEKYWKTAYAWKAPEHTFVSLAKMSIYFLVVGIAKSLVLALVAVLAFLLSFFPVFSILVLFLGLLVIAFDCSDLAYELLEFGFKERFRFFKKHFWEYCGFAMAISIISIIPGFNFIFLPFMVLGASHMVYNLSKLPEPK